MTRDTVVLIGKDLTGSYLVGKAQCLRCSRPLAPSVTEPAH